MTIINPLLMACSGYMSPEYAMGGIFSVKSDVFSFGVIVLEILSGKKNRTLYDAESSMTLLGHVSIQRNEISFINFHIIVNLISICVSILTGMGTMGGG